MRGLTPLQHPQWKYGTTLAGSGVATGHLLREKIAPDGGRTLYAYNRLSQPLSATDANGTVHLFDYSKRGLLRHDRVTTLGTGLNANIRRISTSYDALERLWKVGSYSNANPASTYPTNEVAREYDAFGQLAREWQNPFGGGAVNSYAVTYTHANGSNNTARLTRITYPSGRQVEPTYGAANSASDWLSRVAGVRDAGENLQVADYQFLGEDTAVICTYNQPAVALSYLRQGTEPNGEAGDQYAGLDRFGRDIDHRWLKGGTDIERIGYGYDQAGLRTWRSEAVAAAQGKLLDDHYGYDGLSQVKARDQGRLNPSRTGINGIPDQAEAWDYDPAGNWDRYQRDATGVTDLEQERTHTPANEIRTIDASSIALAYDAAGNMTKVPQAETGSDYYTIEWDAWNRPVYIFNPLASHAGSQGSGYPSEDWDQIYYIYDGLHRRVQAYAWGYYYYRGSYCWYDDQWKCIEERDANWRLTTYLFGARGRNDLVSRDWQDDAWATQRHYALCDAMSSKVAITDAAGAIVERYTYSAFGQSQVLDPNWNPRPETLYDWQTRFHGETRDPETGYYNYGYRYYNPMLGRWLSRDPIEELGGVNLYLFVNNASVDFVDELGMSISYCECSGICTAFLIKQALNAIIAVEAVVASAEALMELPIRAKALNMGLERLESLGNTIFRNVNSFVRANPKMPGVVSSTLRGFANWARTAGTFTGIPGIRSKVAAVRRFAKTGRTIVRAARGASAAAVAAAAGIEVFCLTTCWFEYSRDYFEQRLNDDPVDFLGGG